MEKVVVGLSGGVDSAVAAYLLKEAGYEVVGVTLRTWEVENGKGSRCCEIDDARIVASRLGMEYYALNCSDAFKDKVTGPFTEAYIRGLTPNPCIGCNRYVKWERMMQAAGMFGASFVATGHYARVVKKPDGRYTVKKASHAEKDQTYMLYALTQEQLSATLMPLSDLSKQEVRDIAKKADLHIADKADSQEICFVSDDGYADYIIKNARGEIPPEGMFVDEQGNVLGRHKGIIHYTVGQRRGLGLPLGYPAYVKEIRPGSNEVVIGSESSLMKSEITCRDLNFLSIPDVQAARDMECTVKIRYHHKGQKARLIPEGADRLRIIFEEPVKAATPGQSAVFYDDEDCVIGGGVIEFAECVVDVV